MTERLRQFADVERGDVIVAKDGSRWLVGRVERVARTGVTRVRITRDNEDPVGSDKPRDMDKPSATPVTIDRPEPDVSVCEKHGPLTVYGEGCQQCALESEPTETRAVREVESQLGGQVLATVTDAQQASLDAAVGTGEVLRMPAFASWSILSQRSHLFLCHNLIADDVTTRAELATMHAEVTATPVQGPPVPAHTHADA